MTQMTFGPRHYVPTLKVKRAEKSALKCVAPLIKQHITPLLEIVERHPLQGKTLTEHLDTSFKGLADSLKHYSRCFIDTRELAESDPTAAIEVFKLAAADKIRFTPVTGIQRKNDLSAALTNRAMGVALRLTRDDLDTGRIGLLLTSFMKKNGLQPSEVDLIVDLGELDKFVVAGAISLTQAFVSSIPNQPAWRTFTLIGCSFPSSMGGVKRNSSLQVERVEWISWCKCLFQKRKTLLRLPTFGDGAIQHPAGVEGYDPRTMPSSAAIRYTLDDHWLLIKGQSTRTKLARLQFPELAKLLVVGPHSACFAGQSHCEGCAGIIASIAGEAGFGSLEAWRRLGTIHHLTRAIERLEALPWP